MIVWKLPPLLTECCLFCRWRSRFAQHVLQRLGDKRYSQTSSIYLQCGFSGILQLPSSFHTVSRYWSVLAGLSLSIPLFQTKPACPHYMYVAKHFLTHRVFVLTKTYQLTELSLWQRQKLWKLMTFRFNKGFKVTLTNSTQISWTNSQIPVTLLIKAMWSFHKSKKDACINSDELGNYSLREK